MYMAARSGAVSPARTGPTRWRQQPRDGVCGTCSTVAGAGEVLSDGRNDGFVGFAKCAIVRAQIEAGLLRFDARQEQRPTASGARRAKPIHEFVSGDVSHSRQSSTSHGSNSINCPASANDNFARRKGASCRHQAPRSNRASSPTRPATLFN